MTNKEAIDKLEHLINSPVGREEIDETCFEVMKYLAAQEPRVMTLEEWREWKRKPLSQREPVYYVDNKGLGSWIAPNDQLFIYATPELGYGILFVCWTSRPTDEQREAVKWE
jgi:hypothetical protein